MCKEGFRQNRIICIDLVYNDFNIYVESFPIFKQNYGHWTQNMVFPNAVLTRLSHIFIKLIRTGMSGFYMYYLLIMYKYCLTSKFSLKYSW